MGFFFSFHLLITLCTQLSKIKEQLQSRSRKLELKGFSLFLPAPSLLTSRHFSSNGSASLSAERGDVCPSRAVPSSPFLLLYLAKTVLSRAPGPGIAENPSGSEARGGLRPSRGLIRSGTLSRRVSKATEKRSTFHPLLLSVTLSVHTTAVYCANP